MNGKTEDQNENIFAEEQFEEFKQLVNDESGTKKIPDKPKKSKVGRKNNGLTKQHLKERLEFEKELRNVPQNKNFNSEIIERVEGEIIEADNLKQFEELYRLTCQTVLEQFKQENEELTKLHPNRWYKPLCIKLKSQLPLLTYKDIDKLFIAWDCLSEFMQSIGLFISQEWFCNFTKVYKYQLEKESQLNPKYIQFRQKMDIEADNAIFNEVLYNPSTQIGRIYYLKQRGYSEKNEPIQVEVVHNMPSYDAIKRYRLEDQGENS